MRTITLTVLFMFIALTARADKPKSDDAIDTARKWLTAIHDRDVDAAVALVNLPLVGNLCGDAKARITRDDAADVKKRFTCFAGEGKPSWSIDKNVKFSIATAQRIHSIEADADSSGKATPISDLATDHQIVLATFKWITAPSPVRPSFRESYYLLAIGTAKAGLRIDAIVQDPLLMVAN